MNPHHLAARIEEFSAIDGPSQAAGAAVRDALGSGTLKSALRGDWMGHALHPLLTDTVIGTWTSGLLLDLTGGQGADRLVAAGIICAVPTALSGATDWADAEERDPGARRVGALHAVANVAALALQIRSLSARRRGARGQGIALSLAANGLLGASGYLGGHLSYAEGVGVGRRGPGGDGSATRSGATPSS
jgi:uncharacterized membrane protein